jgi:hypothetical protein
VRHAAGYLEVHPRVIMRILRHADVSMTMEIYANASSTATSEALPPAGGVPAMSTLRHGPNHKHHPGTGRGFGGIAPRISGLARRRDA